MFVRRIPHRRSHNRLIQHESDFIPLRDRLLAAWRRRGRGFARTWGLLQKFHGGATLRCRTRYGSIFELEPFSYIDSFIITHGYYEAEVIEALLPWIGESRPLWDIGANFGLHGITAKRLIPSAEVCCFEPAPPVMARLLLHRALNRTDVRAFALALSNRAGGATLALSSSGNSGMSTLEPVDQAKYAGTCFVATVRGDDLISDGTAPAPAAIKLDVEGHEFSVLSGLEKTLRSPTCRCVVFEDRADLLAPGVDSPVKSLLGTCGFEVASLARHEPAHHPLANFQAIKASP
jgi:FkbM family methyltransferase